MENTVYSDSSTSAAWKRVFNCLNFSLKKKYNIDNENIVRNILKVHGMDTSNFDVIANIERSLASGLADNSIDQNSNKSGLSIPGLSNETITVPYNKIVGYRELYRKLKDLYGKSESKRLMGELFDFSLAMNDSGQILKPYCFSYDFSKLVMEGRNWGQLQSKPPSRLASYISCLNETVHNLASATAGACAVGTFFLDAAHILIYKENISFKKLNSKKYHKYITNCYQNFIHSINHLSRNNTESPFTNISIMDKPKLRGLVDDNNMGWYFNDKIKGVSDKKKKEYVINFIMELQKIFIDFFDKGDPLGGGKPYRFPVVTLNITKNDNGEVEDKEFLNYISTKEVFRYNIMVGKQGRYANCCRLLSDADMFDLGGQINSLGMSQVSLGSHRVVAINFNRIALEVMKDGETADMLLKQYFNIVRARAEDAAKILMAHKVLIGDLEKKGYQPFITNGYIKMDRMFSTIGIAGIVEAIENISQFGKIEKEEVLEKTLTIINDLAKEFGPKYKININIEQIPAESTAIRLHDVDQIIFSNVEVSKTPLYANQWISLWEDHSIWERMDLDGKVSKLLTGGGILHFNIKDKPTSKQINELISYAIKSGAEHFALNAVYSECGKNHTSFGNHTKCPICGGSIVSHYTRVVGFATRVEDWSKVRREWDFNNRVFSNFDNSESKIENTLLAACAV